MARLETVCLLVIVALLIPSALCLPETDVKESLIGYSEDYHLPKTDLKKETMEVVSWDPRIFLYRNLLTDEECDHLIAQATPRLARSGVVDASDGHGHDAVSEIRTSSGMFFERGEDEVIRRVEAKLSARTMIPVGNGEGIQVLRYGLGQEYKPHFDYFFHAEGEDNGGNRIATVLMYLSDVEEGGETVFPNVPTLTSDQRRAKAEGRLSPCAAGAAAALPRKGDATVFWSLRTDGTFDSGALHGSCPVVKGVKWAATKWFHVAHFATGGEQAVAVHHRVYRKDAPPGCEDAHPSCPNWADSGECTNNAGFMVGGPGSPGACLLSCDRCDLAPKVNGQ